MHLAFNVVEEWTPFAGATALASFGTSTLAMDILFSGGTVNLDLTLLAQARDDGDRAKGGKRKMKSESC